MGEARVSDKPEDVKIDNSSKTTTEQISERSSEQTKLDDYIACMQKVVGPRPSLK
jgi:hypothetical protein